MTDAVRWLTYAEIAEAFGIGPDSARNLVRRKRWTRQTGNDGLARVGVPVDQITARSNESDAPSDSPSDPPASVSIDPPGNPPTDGPSSDSVLVALEVLREHIGRLEAEIVSLKDEAGRERARAAQVDALTAILDIERNRSQELRQERDRWSAAAEAFQQQLVDQARRPRGFLGWFRRAG